MRLFPRRAAASVLFAALAAAGCVPAYQYEPLTVTALDAAQSRSITVHSQGAWRDTGIQMRKDEVYQVSTSGTWKAGALCPETGAGGIEVETLFCMKGIFAQNFPLPSGHAAALVGRIGPDGPVFEIGGTRGFIANADGVLHVRMNDPDDFIWDNVGRIELMVQRYGEGVAPPVASAPPPLPAAAATPPAAKKKTTSYSSSATSSSSPRASSSSSGSGPDRRVAATGYYAAERDITFNVLESVSFDPATGELSLAGRYDPKYAGPRIPYLQHLAVFLDNPGPQASLDWAPEFERRVDAFFARMDDPNEMARLVGGGQLLDDEMRVTRKGRLYLPMFGVRAFAHGNAPGDFGANLSFKELGVLRVDYVTPGAAADRAGIAAGDEISMVTVDDIPNQPHIVDTFTRIVRFAGAGARVSVWVSNSPAPVEVTLDAYTGDPWEHVTKYDILERIFRAADRPEAANLFAAVGELLRNKDNQAGPLGFYSLLFATDTLELFENNRGRVERGEMTQHEAGVEVSREVVRGMERNMGLPYDSIVPVYDREYARTGDPFGPIDVAILELNRLAEPIVKDALRDALHKNDQITMPVSVLDENMDFSPQVRPRYIGISGDSELARLFIEADYIGKAIIHRPELSQRIPGYQTEYAFTGVEPGRVEETTNRLWIEPARLDVSRSPDGGTLRFGKTDMKINVGRAIGGGTEHRDTAYANFLSGLYDDFAAEFPALHELREASKVATAARWINTRAPGFKLPREGRAVLTPPDTLEGFVTLIWSPHSIKVTLIAPGGIDFNVPPIGPSGPVFPDAATINVPVDSSVVDLRDLGTSDMPKLDPVALGQAAQSVIPERYRRPLTEPPVPPSVRLVALATKGTRTLARIDGLTTQARLDAARCDADQARTLHDKLSEAAGLARQLQGAEKALNAITSQLPERQRAFEELEQTFREEQQRLRETAMDLATNGLLGAYDELKGSVKVRSIQDLETLIATMNDAKDKLEDISDKLSNLDLVLSAAMAQSLNEREKATSDLLEYLKDTLSEGASVTGNDAVSRALRTAGKTINVAGKVQDVADTAASLYKLNAAVDRLNQLGTQSEQELRGLRDSLLPLKDDLSRRLDTVMNDPAVKAYESGSGRFDCGG